jgi:hypothetical protein
MSDEEPEKIIEEELPEKITDDEGYLYEKIPVDGRTEILVAGNKSTPLPEYYKKRKGQNSMTSLGNYDDLKMSVGETVFKNVDIKSNPNIIDSKTKLLKINGYDLTEDTVKGHIFQSRNMLSDMFIRGDKTRRIMKDFVIQIKETEPNLYKQIGKDPNYKPPSHNDKYGSSSFIHDGSYSGGRKHRRNSKKRNTKRRNSKKRRSHKRR